ncbi:GGDEF domain-containing protein [Candidatus Micrarchaeota archaeon]|nr:GGDEF domain-containing protein [Candidatus Micrarchaeota archaeon]
MNSFKDPSQKDIQLLCQDKASGGGAFRKKAVRHEGLLDQRTSESTKLLKTYGIKLHGSLEVKAGDLQPDSASYKAAWLVGRFASEDFGSLSGYLFELLSRTFNHVSRCSIYLTGRVKGSSRPKTILSHHLTITMNGNVKTESLDKRQPITDTNDPALRAYLDKKPRFRDHREGTDLIVKNLNIESNAGDLHVTKRNILMDDMAFIPFYYREKHKPCGVLILEGDLRCKGSQKSGFGKAFFSIKTAMGLGAQLGFISMQKYDAITSFHRKGDFEIDLKASLRSIVKERSRGSQKSVFVLLIDLDNFKSVNDQHGYLAGDALLGATARAIENSVRRPEQGRKPDTIARWGGEEFVIILEDITHENVLRIAKRIKKEVGETRVPAGEKEIGVTCSIGLLDVGATMQPFDSGSIDETAKHVFNRCDELLKVVKKNEKNGIALVSENGDVELVK